MAGERMSRESAMLTVAAILEVRAAVDFLVVVGAAGGGAGGAWVVRITFLVVGTGAAGVV